MRLTGDGHVHSEWSWDTGGPRSDAAGRMRDTCLRAEAIGLPALAFTEHLDLTGWAIDAGDLPPGLSRGVDADGIFTPEPLDASGYLESVDRCRREFPELRILTGVELGQPHLDRARARGVIDLDALDRVNGSLHTLPLTDDPGAVRSEPITLYRRWPAERVVEAYAVEYLRMVESDAPFDVATHLDYAVRAWPFATEGPFDPSRFEEPYRAALRALARSGRALELNVGGGIRPWIGRWWVEEGGRAITLASDTHDAVSLARSFPEAMAYAEQLGFRPGSRPEDPWIR